MPIACWLLCLHNWGSFYTETDYRPATFSSPEGQTYECGAQDQGNELSMLLNEVGAQSFMDVKEKEKDTDAEQGGPAGNA